MNIAPDTKRILLYGDSLVFGKIPGGLRYNSATRFTGVMQNELGTTFDIIEEGLRGRMISGENSFFPHRNGLEQFGPIFGSQLPVDLLILLLGTNDTNSGSHKTREAVVESFAVYKNLIEWWCGHLGFLVPPVVLIAPPIVDEEHSYQEFKDIFKGARAKSGELQDVYENIASENAWHFLDSSQIVKASPVDGIHLDEENNKRLGCAVARCVQSILS